MSQDVSLRFLEIEHKFLVGSDFDEIPLLEKLRAAQPEKAYKTEVLDTYFLTEKLAQGVFRHRIDKKLQQLTYKSLAGDSEIRTEINLGLDLHAGDQREAVEAFLSPLNILWFGTLAKSVNVFYFPDAEVVFYRARFGQRAQSCIEIEARSPKSLSDAQRILHFWENYLGLLPSDRCKASLLELLVVPSLPSSLQERLHVVSR